MRKFFKIQSIFSFSAILLSGSLLAAPTQTQVDSLIRSMGSPSASQRAEAEKALLELGPEALPFLPESARSPEVRMRLNRVRMALERQTAENSLEAGIVSLPKTCPVGQIPEKVARQTQNALEFSLPEDATFTAAAQTPFWEFLDAFCDQFHLAPQTLPGKRGLKLVPTLRKTSRSASQNARVAYLKPFRLEPLKITSSILFGNDVPGTLLQLELAWEPRITPVFAYLKLREADFFDAEGQPLESSLKLPANEHEILIGQNEFRALCELPLPGASIPAGAHSMTLRGTLSAVACGTKKDFIFEDLPSKLDHEFPPVSERTAAVLVTLTGLRSETLQRKPNSTEAAASAETERFLVATLRYRYEESHEAMESHRTWIYENDAALRKPDGTSLASERSELLRQTPNEIAADLYFRLEGAEIPDLTGWKLIFPRPGGIYEVEYPFEIQAITIP